MSDWDAFPAAPPAQAAAPAAAPAVVGTPWDAFPAVGAPALAPAANAGAAPSNPLASLSDEQLQSAIKNAKPGFDDPDYVAFMAKKHGMSPTFVQDIYQSMVPSEAIKGVPVLGAYEPQAHAAVSAAAQPVTGAGAQGASYKDRYAKNLAFIQEMEGDAEGAHPNVAKATQMIGGGLALTAGGGTAVGARLLGLGARTLPGQVLSGMASGGALNAADAAARGEDVGSAAVSGTLMGGAFPVVARGAGAIAAPIVSAVKARVNPQGYAESQFARSLADSGQTAQSVTDEIARAAAAGQGEFTAADAMGHSGQRLLSTVARAPGPGRQEAIDFLDARQGGQGRRIANILAEGMQAPQTAAQATTRLTAARDAAADVNYGAARGSAGTVDVSPAIAMIDRTLQPGVTRLMSPQTNIADNSIEAALRQARGYLTDGRSQLTDFDSVLMAKREIDNLIENGTKTQQAFLIPVKNALDGQLAAASPVYANARNEFARGSRVIEAVDTGTNAAMRGRTEDTVPAFRAMPPAEQQAFRVGYVDPMIADVQRAAVGVNKARPFTSDAMQTELHAMAPVATGNDMMTRLARENRMFETRAKSTQGSQTAENLEDAAAQRIDPHVLAALASGHPIAAAQNLMRGGINALSGYTPEVRQRLAQLLLMRGQNPQVGAAISRAEADFAAQRARAARALRAGIITSRAAGLQAHQDAQP